MANQSLEDTLNRLQASLGEGQARAASALDDLGGHLALAREHLDTLGEAAAAGKNEIGSFAGSISAGIQDLRDALAGHLASIQECRERIAQADRDLAQRNENIAAARQRIAQLESAAAQQADAAQAAAMRIARLEEQVNQQKDALPEARQRLEQLAKELAERTTALQNAEQRGAALEQLAGEKSRDLADVSARLAEQQQAGTSLRDQLAAQTAEAGKAISERDALAAEAETLRNEARALREIAQRADGAEQRLQAEHRRVQELEGELQHETAKGTKTVIAEQLAQVLRELEEAHAESASLRRELAMLQGGETEAMAPAAADEPGTQAEPPLEPPLEPERLPEAQPAAALFAQPEPEMEPELTAAQAEKRRRERIAARRGLGMALRANNTVTEEQLEAALETLEREPQRSMREILVEQGAATEEGIAEALAKHHHTQFVRITEDSLDPEATALITQRIAQIHACIPLKATDETVDLAMVDPLDLIAIEDVERASGRSVRAVVATVSDINKAIGWAYY